MGLITNNERYNQIVDIWSRVDTRLTETLIRELASTSRIQLCVYDAGFRCPWFQTTDQAAGWYKRFDG